MLKKIVLAVLALTALAGAATASRKVYAHAIES